MEDDGSLGAADSNLVEKIAGELNLDSLDLVEILDDLVPNAEGYLKLLCDFVVHLKF